MLGVEIQFRFADSTDMKASRIVDVVEPQAMRQLGVEQADNMVPWAEGSALGFHPALTRQAQRQMGRTEVANFANIENLVAVGLSPVFIHPYFVAGANQ